MKLAGKLLSLFENKDLKELADIYKDWFQFEGYDFYTDWEVEEEDEIITGTLETTTQSVLKNIKSVADGEDLNIKGVSDREILAKVLGNLKGVKAKNFIIKGGRYNLEISKINQSGNKITIIADLWQ